MTQATVQFDDDSHGTGGQTLVTDSRPPISSAAEQPDDTPPPANGTRDLRSEVNAYATAILARLLVIVGQMPAQQRGEVEDVEREIHQMLAFIDPEMAANVADLAPADLEQHLHAVDPDATVSAIDDRLATLIRQFEERDLQHETTIEALRDIRASLVTLREDLRSQHEATTEALRTLTSTSRSLHYSMTALAARSEQIADLSGVAEEQIRVDVWKYALIAGISSGAIVAAIMLLFDIVN
jgi:hypothetical protein